MAVVAGRETFFRQFRIGRENGPAFAGGEIFRGLKTEAAGVAISADLALSPLRQVRLACVFDQSKSFFREQPKPIRRAWIDGEVQALRRERGGGIDDVQLAFAATLLGKASFKSLRIKTIG